MRYVEKVDTPQFFIDDISGLSTWDEYTNKKPLREYILKEEQNHLCIYCESTISAENDNSHIEHIKPKDTAKYPELTFEYTNLVVSCNGNCHNLQHDENKYCCGHIKDNEYSDTEFLNPVETRNIREYFEYDIDEGKIKSSLLDISKSKYMIDTLHLNEGRLTVARMNSLKSFNKAMKKIKDKTKRKEKMIEILNRESRSQISFLRFRYAKLL